jgi:hypothetical protein
MFEHIDKKQYRRQAEVYLIEVQRFSESYADGEDSQLLKSNDSINCEEEYPFYCQFNFKAVCVYFFLTQVLFDSCCCGIGHYTKACITQIMLQPS